MFARPVAEFARIPSTKAADRLNSCEFRYDSRRRAITLLEITVAATMLAVLMTVSIQMLRALGGQQRAVERRALALQTVQALAEQIGNTPWGELTAEAVQRTEIPAAVKPFLPGGKLAVSVQEEPEPVAAKRVTIELSWNGPSGQSAGPVQLTTWVFPENSSPRVDVGLKPN